jgi:rSAM/selenodomain-associated transferase 1
VTHVPDLPLEAGDAALVVMARALVLGAVKTRLATALGDDGALAVYERLLRDTLDHAEDVPDVALVLATPLEAGPPPTRGTGSAAAEHPGAARDPLADRGGHWSRLTQRGDHLGARLGSAFADLFAAGASSVVIVGSDSPALPAEYVGQAFSRVAPGRVVLGPAADGGYYLIGLDRETWAAHADALSGLLAASPMSTGSLLGFTLRAVRAAGLGVAQLPLWVDVDEPADLGVMDRLTGDAPLRGEPLTGLREVYLHVTHRCGRGCRHCYDRDAARDADELTTAEWKDVIDQAAALSAGSFVFIGGDPLLRDDFIELLDHVTGAHGGRARFFFNSHVDERLAEELAAAGRGRLKPLVSIDGPRAINDELRGEGSYDDVMASIASLGAVGLLPLANTVLVRPVLPGLSQLARELRAAGVTRMHLILPHQAGGAGGDASAGGASSGGACSDPSPGNRLVPTGAELLAAVRELLATAEEVGLVVDNPASWRRRLGGRNDLCAAGCRDLAVDPYGRVHACVITAGDPAFVAGSLREQPLEEIWRASAGLRLLRASRARDRAECLACPVADACGGECWVQAHYAARAHGQPAGYAAPFPYCDLVRPMLEELRDAADQAAREAAALPATAAPAGDDCVAAGACGGQSAAGADDYSLFDCI